MICQEYAEQVVFVVEATLWQCRPLTFIVMFTTIVRCVCCL